jgi:hypothetical protein
MEKRRESELTLKATQNKTTILPLTLEKIKLSGKKE